MIYKNEICSDSEKHFVAEYFSSGDCLIHAYWDRHTSWRWARNGLVRVIKPYPLWRDHFLALRKIL